MKANELRTGNLIELQGKFRRLIMIDAMANVVDVSRVGLLCINEVKPIPLTEEWLLKFGFIWDGDIKILKGYLNDYVDGNGEARLKYVHQLQNLYFALTGEELKPNDNEKQ